MKKRLMSILALCTLVSICGCDTSFGNHIGTRDKLTTTEWAEREISSKYEKPCYECSYIPCDTDYVCCFDFKVFDFTKDNVDYWFVKVETTYLNKTDYRYSVDEVEVNAWKYATFTYIAE